MGDPKKFNHIWEYGLFNFALLMLFVSDIYIFSLIHTEKEWKRDKQRQRNKVVIRKM